MTVALVVSPEQLIRAKEVLLAERDEMRDQAHAMSVRGRQIASQVKAIEFQIKVLTGDDHEPDVDPPGAA